MTKRELAYACLDLLKLASDDSYITVEHVLFLASKVRALILSLKYSDIKKEIPKSNYLTICLDLQLVPAISGEVCEGGTYLRSILKIPTIMPISNTSLYPSDYYLGDITFVSRERMKYVGHNPWLKNIIYASLGPDNYIYFKSSNPQYLYMTKASISAVFEDPDKVDEISTCSENEELCDDLDKEFPLEEGLVSSVIEMIVKALSGALYKPKDDTNDARDDLSDIMTFIRRNMKSNLQKQIEE